MLSFVSTLYLRIVEILQTLENQLKPLKVSTLYIKHLTPNRRVDTLHLYRYNKKNIFFPEFRENLCIQSVFDAPIPCARAVIPTEKNYIDIKLLALFLS